MFRIVFVISLMAVVRSAPSPFYTRSSVRTPTSYVSQYLVVPDKHEPYRVPLTQVHHVNDFKFPKQQVFYHNPQAHSSLHNIHENSPMWQNLMEMMKQKSEGAEDSMNMEMMQSAVNDAMTHQPSDAMDSKMSQRETKLMTEAIMNGGSDMPTDFNDNPFKADDVNAEMIQREAKAMGEVEFIDGSEKMIDSGNYAMTQESTLPENQMAKLMEEKSMVELMNDQAVLEMMREKTYKEFMQMTMEVQRMQANEPQLQQEPVNIEPHSQEKISFMEMTTEAVPFESRVSDDSEASQSQAIEMPKIMVNHENRMEVLKAMMEILQSANLMTEVQGEKSAEVITPQILMSEEIKKDDTGEIGKSIELNQGSIPEMTLKQDLINAEANQTKIDENISADILSEENLTETEVLKEDAVVEKSQKIAENEIIKNDNEEAQKLITENLTITQMLELLELMKSMFSTTQSTPTTSEMPQVVTETSSQLITESPSTTPPNAIIINETLADPIITNEVPIQPKSMQEIMQEILKINQASLNILEMMTMVQNSISSANSTENDVESITEVPAKVSELMSNMLKTETQPRIDKEITSTEAALMSNEAMQSNDDESSRNTKAMELEVVANGDAQGENFEMRMVEVTTEDNTALPERNTEQSESTENKSESPTETSTGSTSLEFNDESSARHAEINPEDNENENEKTEEENSEEQSVSARQGRVDTSPTLFLHNNRFYVVSGAPEFYANFDAYQKPRTPIFSLQELEPIRPIDKNARVQRVEPFRIYVGEDENDKSRNGDDNEREIKPLKLNESQAHDNENEMQSSADGEVKKPEQASAGKGQTRNNLLHMSKLHNNLSFSPFLLERELSDDSSIAQASPDAVAIVSM